MKPRPLAAWLLLFAWLGCAPPEPTPLDPAPAPVSRDPEMRIGVLLNVGHVTLTSASGVEIVDPDEGLLHHVDGLVGADVGRKEVILTSEAGEMRRRAFVVSPTDTSKPLQIEAHQYRGSVELRWGDSGVTVINHIPLEQYLVGVVAAEMGQRASSEIDALRAQAVVSRTYAIRNQGRWQDRGFDLAGSVNDQVYNGDVDGASLARAAVRDTRGEILTFDGQPIDAFFSSTCGGRTEDGSAAFSGAERSYLRAVDDVDPNGVPWCAASPRLHWTASWSAEQLAATLRRTLRAENLTPLDADLRDINIIGRTRTGRVATIDLVSRGARVRVSGQAIRRVLSPTEGGWLRSTDFTLRISRSGARIERIDATGRGNGHAVGMCQWGAIGRARAGQDYRTILTSYFPGTAFERLY